MREALPPEQWEDMEKFMGIFEKHCKRGRVAVFLTAYKEYLTGKKTNGRPGYCRKTV